MKHCLYLCILSLIILCTNVKAQVDEINPTSDFIYRGNHFLPGSPWLIVGTGYGKNFSENTIEPNFMVDFHYQFEKKNQCIGFGYLTSRDQFLTEGNSGLFVPNIYLRHSTNSLHGMYGIRFERNIRHSFAGFLGPSYNWGYRHAFTDTAGYDYHIKYNEVGFYASLQYSYKIFYDLGVGVSVWASYCESYQVVGFAIHLYLSSAFKRKIN